MRRTRPGWWLVVLGGMAGCALKEPPLPERASARSPLVYAYQQPSDVLDADWVACDLEADRWARYDYRASQEAALAAFGGGFGGLGGAVGSSSAFLTVVTVEVAPFGVIALNETALAQIPVVKRRRVREQLADMNDYYARRAHRCLTATGYRLPVPRPSRGTTTAGAAPPRSMSADVGSPLPGAAASGAGGGG